MNQAQINQEVYDLNAKLIRQRDEQRLEDLRKAAERLRLMNARWNGVARWVAEHMPDMVDADGEVCPFACHAAKDLKANGIEPTPDAIREYRRRGWAHIREEEEGQG